MTVGDGLDLDAVKRDCHLNVKKKIESTLHGLVINVSNEDQLTCLRGLSAEIEQDTVAEASDWLFPAPWGLDRIDQLDWPLDIAYWRGDTGVGTRVYVVDTGVRAGHEEFPGRVEAGGDVPGTDDNGHGTHVAGIIAGQNVGVAPGARIVSVKVLDSLGEGPVSDVIAGLDWVLRDYTTRGGRALVNMSLSASGSKALNAAVARLVDAGVPVVVAAGNSGSPVACASPGAISPASEEKAIVVGATGEFDVRPSDSNYGSCLDIFAPGVRIESADNADDSARALRSGTSMATAFVSGALARVMSPAVGPPPANPRAVLLAAALGGVVGSRGSGSPDKFLYTGPGPGPFTPPPATELAPSAASHPAAQEESAARQVDPPRIVRVRYSRSGRRITLWISYQGSSRIEVLRDERVVMRTVRRRVTVRAGNDRRDVLRLRAMDSGVAASRPGRRQTRAVRVRDSIRIVRG